jgi:RNA polymerase sigma factor (sigma-70 family)
MGEAVAAAGFSRLLSDERLTRRAVGGDERAFAAIFQRYHQSLYRFCLTIVGNPDDAQEALQNTMTKVLRALPGEEREIDLKPWLYRIAHNESIDLLRRRREARELDVEQVAPGYGLTEDVATRERLRRLIADLQELPERQREVLVMRELAGLDFEEIGSALSTSGAVARQTLYEARQSLRQMEAGREMSCDAVQRALSDGDGRVARRRDIRAHLRSCAGCRSFRDEIGARQRDLAALSPLPAIAAAGMLQGMIGGTGAAASGGLAVALGGGAAKSIGASAAAKGVATVAVAAAIGVTAADRTGVVHVGLPGGGDEKASEAAPAPHSHGNGHGHGNKGNPDAVPQGGNGSGAGKAAGSQAGAKAPGNSQGASARHGSTKSNLHSRGGKGKGASRGHGPPAHPAVKEKQHPPGAQRGQETADAHKPPPREPPAATGGSSEPGPQTKSPDPASPSAPVKESPPPPEALPESRSQQPETEAPASAKTAEPGSTGADEAAGKAVGKIP